MVFGSRRNKFNLGFLNTAPREQSDMMAYEIAELRSFFSLETVIYYLSIAHMASSGRRTSIGQGCATRIVYYFTYQYTEMRPKLVAMNNFCIEHSHRRQKLLTQIALKHRCARKSLKVVVKKRRREAWEKTGYDRILSTGLSLALVRLIHFFIGVTHELVIIIKTNELPGCSFLRHRGPRTGIGCSLALFILAG